MQNKNLKIQKKKAIKSRLQQGFDEKIKKYKDFRTVGARRTREWMKKWKRDI